jgi:signal transduction histidine kinase
MSHELRTPLNAIGGHAQLLEMGLHGSVNDAQRDALGRVQRSQRHLLAMINDLLNLARCDSGQVAYAIEHVSLVPIVESVVELLAPLGSTNGLSFDVVSTTATGAEPIVVQADAEKLNQILSNVVGNAIKFSPSGGRIVVEVARCATDASLASVSVRDPGVGIPPAKLASIFEPFVQLGGNSASQRDGVGLGLSISRTLARGMGGDLTATSEVCVGSTLTLTLPLA